MIGFGNIFKAELYKLVKLKTLLKILIAVLIIFVIFTLLYSVIYNILGEFNLSLRGDVTKETVEHYEKEYNDYAAALDGENAMIKAHDSELYSKKATAVLYRYLYDNDLDFNTTTEFGAFGLLTANAYITYILNIMATVITIFAIVSIIKSFAGERTQGTLKMQLLRPISKEAMITAKFLAVLVVSFGLYLLTFVLAGVVGVIAYDVDAKQVVGVLNASHVFTMSPFGALLVYFVYYISFTFAYITLGLFLSVISRKSEAMPIVISLVLLLVGATIEDLLGYIFIGYIGFNLNTSWVNALTTTGPGLNYMNLYSMLGISLVWVAGMLVSSFFIFKKSDIHT